MLIDTDLLFDDLVGFEFYHQCEVKAVIDDKVKCDDGEILEFYENIEYLIEEYDQILILKKRQTLEDQEGFKSFLIERNNSELLKSVEANIEVARRDGVYETFACVHDDTFYDLPASLTKSALHRNSQIVYISQ
ncbi:MULTISPECIES: hypothetical protein [Pseudoalteromonas]|uniref:hypothetical protein n=1 Tax=Pseudoalteromonas TaxID=53246 RepID=UPI00030A45C9|nr:MULTISPECIES: hypothetical protein [Pseudoalteromonas]MCF6143561.1 hypothetical protein [Pseudoalteromonas mariniglutinosa NCIMB 1770]